jgi:hypothetical protein
MVVHFISSERHRKLPVTRRVALCLLVLLCALLAQPSQAQVIEFESGGLQYQTLTREGLTIMLARLPATLRSYSVIQVSVANGSADEIVVRPEDFHFETSTGRTFSALPARTVVRDFIRNPNRDDVIKLVGTYEMSLYGMNPRANARNGYESRRRSAIAELSFKNLKAAAAASAIAFVQTTLPPGDTTDGAVFFPSSQGPLQNGRVVVKTEGGLEFRFNLFREIPASQ